MCGRRFTTWRSAARPLWAGTSPSAITAARYGTTIIPAATEAVPSAVEASGRPGWPNVRPTSCPFPTSTSSSPCPTSSARWPWATVSSCIGCSSTAAKETLLEVAADPKHLGARIGVLMVLHTWGQKLEHHPHVHCVVPGGGLAVPAKTSGNAATDPGDQAPRWVSCRPNWFLPVKVLSPVFRGKYLAALRGLPSRPTPVRWEHLAPGEPGGLGGLDTGVVPEGLGSLCQGALRRA